MMKKLFNASLCDGARGYNYILRRRTIHKQRKCTYATLPISWCTSTHDSILDNFKNKNLRVVQRGENARACRPTAGSDHHVLVGILGFLAVAILAIVIICDLFAEGADAGDGAVSVDSTNVES